MAHSGDSGENGVAEAGASPSSGAKNARSSIQFPYFDLQTVVTVAKTLYEHFGSECSPDQLAAVLGHENARSGAYSLKTAAAQMYGVIERERGVFRITPLGRAAIMSETEAQASVAAFLRVPLYRRIYESFKGVALPSEKGLENEISKLGVAPKQVDKARQVFQKSGDQAGLFWLGKNRLVLPKGISDSWLPGIGTEDGGGEETSMRSKEQEAASEQIRRLQAEVESMRSSAVDPSISGLPLAVSGVLTTLPKQGTSWTEAEMDAWADMFKQVLRVAYSPQIRKSSS